MKLIEQREQIVNYKFNFRVTMKVKELLKIHKINLLFYERTAL